MTITLDSGDEFPEALLQLRGTDQRSVFFEMLAALEQSSRRPRLLPHHRAELVTALLQREELGSTVVSPGICLPHVRHIAVPRFYSAIGFSSDGIPWNAPDGAKATTVILYLSPKEQIHGHLQALAHVARIVRDQTLIERWRFLAEG